MTLLRRLSLLALGTAVAHLVFGAIVRISGAGMGCGDHWPKCHGRWFPSLANPILAIEWTHRLLASVLTAGVAALVAAAWARRRAPGVAGRGGLMRGALLALALVIATAVFGMVTVKLGNPPLATVVHWLLAAMTVAALAATAMRGGALGAAGAGTQPASPRTARGAAAAVGLALATVVLGGLTAKVPGANVACPGFPWCRGEVITHGGALHIQLTHRVLAFLLFFHVLALAWGVHRRGEGTAVRRAALVAAGLVVLQLIIAAALVETRLPPALRSLHQAVGVGVWLSLFTLAYLARAGARLRADGSVARLPLPWGAPPEVQDRPMAGPKPHPHGAGDIASAPIAPRARGRRPASRGAET